MQKHSLNRKDIQESLLVYLRQFPSLLGVDLGDFHFPKKNHSPPLLEKKMIAPSYSKLPTQEKVERLECKEIKISAPPSPKARPYKPKEQPYDLQEFAKLAEPAHIFLLPPCDAKARLLQKDHSKEVFTDICLLISSSQKKDLFFIHQMEKLALALKIYGSVSLVEIEFYQEILKTSSSFLLLRQETLDLLPDFFENLDSKTEGIVQWKEHSLLLLPSHDLYQLLEVKKKIWHTLRTFFDS